MNKYIFLTNEWFTYQPESFSTEPDVENSQLIGISSWISKQDAFLSLKKENTWLKETNFNEIYCFELKDDKPEFFSLK